ncbi:MAG: helix-turn-helix domain-containing protein [Herbiconiux sp.]|nr:helix-turn-helix domain-containing protein [Herbiconiux sp.]
MPDASAPAPGADTETADETGTESETAAATDDETATRCQIARTLDVVGEKWSLLIVRDAFRGRTRFREFQDSLGASTDILSARLTKLVEAGVLEKRPYREPGSRERSSYHLTEAGQGLALVLGALVQWGDEFRPHPAGRSSIVVDARDHSPATLAFLTRDGAPVPARSVAFTPGPAARTTW